jgi:ectoine hydroxylase-related dioxygenase (phytanoyl-CoA dioxygenase family)
MTGIDTDLSDEEFAQYQHEGYVVRSALTRADVEAATERLRAYTSGERDPGGISMQVEPRVQRGELEAEDESQAYRKLSDVVANDDLFYDIATKDAIVEPIKRVLGPHLKLFRSAVLMKPPQVGSEKGAHQDAPYWPIQPEDECSVWIPLDRATVENGCMQVIPGDHLRGGLPHVPVTDDYVIDEDCYERDDLEPLPMAAGQGLFFHALLPHYTNPNETDRWRRAIVLSYMSARSRYTGDGDLPDYPSIAGESFPGSV